MDDFKVGFEIGFEIELRFVFLFRFGLIVFRFLDFDLDL